MTQKFSRTTRNAKSTEEQKRTYEICGARKRDGSGEVCKLPAGWGTPHPGTG